ncbi:fibronectin type III domain containing protein 3C1-like [Zalophus californianus]|uniref:Fibronectin type III domain containing protein 3C1-like n=1 Tax=Zalophus californianus TaxID=9704 RepID=A0A6P9FIU4_ZALCA|nr:fibronectin type III domain containing protein 3C1-like [Zalophus californianus]
MNSLCEDFCVGTCALGKGTDDVVTGWNTPSSMTLTGLPGLKLSSLVAGMLIDRITRLLRSAGEGPADVPLMSPSGTLPPIYLPPGYMSQVVEENGIRKIIIVPQTIDYHTTMPAPLQQVPHFIGLSSPVYPQGPHLMYPPAQGEFPPPYIQEPLPQQLPLPLLPLPLALLPPPPMLPPATFIYQEQHEMDAHGRGNHNQSDERAANMGEHMEKKMREGQLGGHKTSYIVKNTSLLVDKTNDFSSSPDTSNTYTVDYAPSTDTVDNTRSTDTVENAPHTYTVDSASNTYTVDNATSTYTVDNVPCTYTVENTSSTNTVKNTLSTYTVDKAPCAYTVTNAQDIYIADTVDNPPSTHIADNTPSNSSTDHTPSTSTTDSVLPSTTDSVPDPSSTNYVPSTSTSDSTPRPSAIDSTPSSSISDHAPNIPISESAPSTSAIDGALSASSAASNSNTASAHVETSQGKKWSAAGSGGIKKKPGGKQSNSPSPNAAEKECITEHGKSCCFSIEKPVVSDIQTRSAIISWKLRGSEKCDHTKSPVTFELAISNSGKNGKYKNGSNDNGSKINSFLLEWDEGKGEGFKSCYTGTMKQYKILKLNASTKYSFRLAAKNNFGLSDFSEIAVFHTSGTMPPTPPPPKLKEAGVCNLSLEWSAPTNTSPNDSLTYVLEMEEAGSPSDILTIQTPTLSPASCHPLPLHGETKTKETNIKCDYHPNENSEAPAYVNKAEDNQDDKRGYPSSKVRSILEPHPLKCETAPVPSPPSQCGIPVLTCKGPTCVVVSWRIPVCNGAEITEYRLEWGQSEESMHLIYTGPCLSYKVKGLIPATTYFCRVQAANVVGVGLFEETGTVTTPATVPAVVPMLHEVENKVPAKLASSCIAIQWEEPDCHGSPITGYNIEYGDRKILTVERVTEYLLKNLQPDTTYKIRIQAINHYGLSPFSQSIRTKTKPLPLDSPHLDCVVYGHQSPKLKWGISSSKGLLSNLISYNLLIGDQSGRFSIIYHGSCQTHKVHRLSEYMQYKFKIQACNEAGEGPLSCIYTFTTTKPPPAKLKAPKLQHVNSSICEIKWESLEPIKGDPIVYNLQLISQKGTDLIYKGPDTSFSFSNFVTNAHYHFKVCAGRQYQNSAGIQELWGPYSPSVLFSTHKQHPRPGKGGGQKGRSSTGIEKDEKPRIEMSNDTFVLILVTGFALLAILCAVIIQHYLIN